MAQFAEEEKKIGGGGGGEEEAPKDPTTCFCQRVKGQICDSNPRGRSATSLRQWTLDWAQWGATCIFTREV